MVLPHKGGSLCVKDAFAKKFFGAGRDSAGGALAPVGNTLLKAGQLIAVGRSARLTGCQRWQRNSRAAQFFVTTGGGAPDRSVAIGAARPAIRHREPAGWRHQHRHRDGRARACRRLHAANGREQQRVQRGPLRLRVSLQRKAPVSAGLLSHTHFLHGA